MKLLKWLLDEWQAPLPGTRWTLRYRWHGAFGCTGIPLALIKKKCICCGKQETWQVCPKCNRLHARWHDITTYTGTDATFHIVSSDAVYLVTHQ